MSDDRKVCCSCGGQDGHLDFAQSGYGDQAVEVPESARARLEELKMRYPESKSAIMPALYIAQEVFGWLTPQAYAWVAGSLGVPKVHVMQVASFYTMYYKKPVGRYHVQVCRTLSCMLKGSESLVAYIKQRFSVASGEVTEDGMWSFEEVECLGSCGTAPMVQINDVFFENLTIEKLGEIFRRIEVEKPDLRYSTIRAELGGGLADLPRSEVFIPIQK